MPPVSRGATRTRNHFVFNFAASYSGGGYKRLHEYARVFDGTGGATFLIHPRCGELSVTFPNNRYFVIEQARYQRLFDDTGYLRGILAQIGRPDLYYSYGIPVYRGAARVNWFHLSNVLPLTTRGIPLPVIDRLKMWYLGRRIRQHYSCADVISAESDSSLGLIDATQREKLFLSVNGSDDELAALRSGATPDTANVATVVGTYRYKALDDSHRVFAMLRAQNEGLRLVIVGDAADVPASIRDDPNVILKGILDRRDVISCLRNTRYYISTTRIENSYNAASEGIFFADESYISDIGPHRELLKNMPFTEVRVPNMSRPVLHVRRNAISGVNLKSWEDVVAEMIDQVHAKYARTIGV